MMVVDDQQKQLHLEMMDVNVILLIELNVDFREDRNVVMEIDL